MASAIELYREAYEADYRRGDWQYAEELYRKIVEQFPYSDEKEYALVHLERLEKLKNNPKEPSLQPVRGGSDGNALSVVSFLLIIVVISGAGVGGYYVWQYCKATTYNDLVLQGLISEKAGDDASAAVKYRHAQKIMPGNALAYRSMAELYLEHNKYTLAEIERKRWALASPDDPALREFQTKLNDATRVKTNGQGVE
ncbi:MAG: hypothetical protein GF350_05565 [Chitinivibrionales bacterium]|nr:hypothetical protein [Chitinivibrionales bacterium]